MSAPSLCAPPLSIFARLSQNISSFVHQLFSDLFNHWALLFIQLFPLSYFPVPGKPSRKTNNPNLLFSPKVTCLYADTPIHAAITRYFVASLLIDKLIRRIGNFLVSTFYAIYTNLEPQVLDEGDANTYNQCRSGDSGERAIEVLPVLRWDAGCANCSQLHSYLAQ
jgi:hypothetical protein